MTNTGNDITLFIDDVIMAHLNVTDGPLQYSYRLHHMKLHFGTDETAGSEHTINNLSFPAEVLFYRHICIMEKTLIKYHNIIHLNVFYIILENDHN